MVSSGAGDLVTIEGLAARAADAVERLALRPANGQVEARPDVRMLRYYTTLGLLDRPVAVEGRTAYYGERHLLQVLAVKRLQADGLQLSAIQRRLAGRTDDELAELAGLRRTRRGRFWAVPPAAGTAPGTEPGGRRGQPAPAVGVGAAVRLAPGVTLVLDGARQPDGDDLAALAEAAQALLEAVRQRGLANRKGTTR